MNHTVVGLLAGYRDGRLDPIAVARDYGADGGEAARRWQSGTPRGLEGIPVVALDDEARAFAAEHGAIVVAAASAPLGLGGGPAGIAKVARAGGTALLAPGLPAIAAPRAAEIAGVLGALGQAAGAAPARVARIAGLAGATDAARRADDLAASLLRGLGLDVQTLSVTGAGRIGAVAADADALLMPLDLALMAEAIAAHLALLALPGAWSGGGHLGLLLCGKDAAALATLGERLAGAMGN